MTENEAIKELDTSIDLAKMCIQTFDRKKEIEAYNTAIQALEEIQQYRAIGTVDEFKALKEKNEPKKPFQPFGTHSYKCPSCWKFVAHEVDDNCDLEAEMAEWCPYCGQKLDWQ